MGSTSIFFHSSSNCAIGIFENFPSDQVLRVRKMITRGPKQHRDGQTGRQSPRQRPALLAGRGLLRAKSSRDDRGRRRGPGVLVCEGGRAASTRLLGWRVLPRPTPALGLRQGLRLRPARSGWAGEAGDGAAASDSVLRLWRSERSPRSLGLDCLLRPLPLTLPLPPPFPHYFTLIGSK